jgi:transcriptional regulator with XRE-family HTH domain
MDNYEAVSASAHNAAYQLFRALLTELRRSKRVTQLALARLLGVPQSYVSKYEVGERRIDIIETFAICRALGADPVVFLRKVIKTIESKGARSIASSRNSPRIRR